MHFVCVIKNGDLPRDTRVREMVLESAGAIHNTNETERGREIKRESV